jgi:hypothetical protein
MQTMIIKTGIVRILSNLAGGSLTCNKRVGRD